MILLRTIASNKYILCIKNICIYYSIFSLMEVCSLTVVSHSNDAGIPMGEECMKRLILHSGFDWYCAINEAKPPTRENEALGENPQICIKRAYWICITGCHLGGMELTFFLAACMVLYFRFVNKSLPITHQCFGYDWQFLHIVKGFSFFHSAPKSVLEMDKKLGRDKTGTVDPNYLKKRGRKDIHGYGICLHKESLCVVRPCFTESNGISTCKWETGNKFLILFCLYTELLIHLLNFLYLVPHLSTFILLSSPPMGKEGEQRAVWMLGCWPGSAQRSHTFDTISQRRLILMLV